MPINFDQELIKRISNNDPTLTTLDLSNNIIGNEEVNLLITALETNKTLTVLTFNKDKIENELVEKINGFLKRNVRYNEMGKKRGEALQASLTTSSQPVQTTNNPQGGIKQEGIKRPLRPKPSEQQTVDPKIMQLETNDEKKNQESTPILEKAATKETGGLRRPTRTRALVQSTEIVKPDNNGDKKIPESTSQPTVGSTTEVTKLEHKIVQPNVQVTTSPIATFHDKLLEIPHQSVSKQQKKTSNSDEMTPWVLGQNSFSTVYKGMWNYADVAIRELNQVGQLPDLASQQLALLEKLRSPYIVIFYGSYPQGHALGFIKEYMALGSLKRVLTEKNQDATHWLYELDWTKERGQIIREITYGLAYLHSYNLVQHNLTSNNVLIDEHFHAKLDVDFSLEQLSGTQTKQEASLETDRYTAPELLEHPKATVSSATNMYTYGVILYEIAARAALLPTKVLPEIPNDCPEGVAQLIQRCWQTEAEKRPSADAAAKLLSATGFFQPPASQKAPESPLQQPQQDTEHTDAKKLSPE